jgi:hypothetical protein
MGVPEPPEKSQASRIWDKTWPLLVLLVCGWWVYETATNTACEMHGSRGPSLMLHKLCDLGGPWLAASIPAVILAAASVGAWFTWRSK